MSLTRSVTQPQASASNAAAGTTNSSSITVNYGVSIEAQVTNGGSGPTVGCTVNLQATTDGGTTWITIDSKLAGVVANTTYSFRFDLGVCGAGGDWGTVRVQFTGNTGQAVTVQADASSTTSL
jgi:hypothetical protein